MLSAIGLLPTGDALQTAVMGRHHIAPFPEPRLSQSTPVYFLGEFARVAPPQVTVTPLSKEQLPLDTTHLSENQETEDVLPCYRRWCGVGNEFSEI
ncbi:Hypothetical protein Cp106_1474 [Corynebacterium pseudotuberculosis 1/06-A]|nr:Hypothetical protein Cp106_1474 [Corynebacterium pseudotuberculosis 1/06-A]